MPVYLIRAGDTDMVKIGWADENVEARRRELQCAHFLDLIVIRVIEGERWIEGALHLRFKERRVRGEWFNFHPDMLAYEPVQMRAENPDPLLDDVEQFLARTGLAATAFGVLALSDPTFVHEMRRGRECRRATRNQVISFIQSFPESLTA